jgi:GDSL-like lipase/acylhydrolase family protein/carbohydrate binding protein with CBM35 domain
VGVRGLQPLIAAGLLVLPGCSADLGARGGAAASPPRAPSPAPAALRIMPLGDATTDGPGGGYRSDLWQYFQADGRRIDFVGSRSTGPAQLPDPDHEGHPGLRMRDIDPARLRGWLEHAAPDVVLVHLGTNDVIEVARTPDPDGAADGLAGRMDALLTQLATLSPKARVYVATIIPFADRRKQVIAQRYNARLPAVVEAQRGKGRQVRLVEQHRAVAPMPDLLPDGVHPTRGGHAKMAAAWYGALTGAALPGWEAESPVNHFNTVTPLPAQGASGTGKVGRIQDADSYLDVKVEVAGTGNRRMYVRAANGSAGPCTHRLTVNGQAQPPLEYPARGWERWTITARDIPLRAGANTIRFTRDKCVAELDVIRLRGG